MSLRNIINSNFWQIVRANPNGNITALDTANLSNVNLGNVNRVRINGGSFGQFLRTDGTGNLSWAPGGGGGGSTNIQPALEFPVTIDGTNQSFTNPFISNLSSNAVAPVYVNGVLLLTADFEINGDTLTVYGDLNTGDVVTAASTTVTSVTPQTSIASGNSSIVITQNAQITMSSSGVTSAVFTGPNANIIGNLSVTGNITGNLARLRAGTTTVATATDANITLTANGNTMMTVTGTKVELGAVGNIKITGGGSGQALFTDGAGNLSWVAIDSSKLSNGTSNVNLPTVDGNLSVSIGGTDGVLIVGNTDSILNGNLFINGSIEATEGASLGAVANVKITGGSNLQYLQTDGTGNLSWVGISTSRIFNGNSNVVVAPNGNITMSSTGNANIVTVTGEGVIISNNTLANVADLKVRGSSDLGAVANITVTGGSNGQALTTDGTGNLSWSNLLPSNSGYVLNGTAVTLGNLTLRVPATGDLALQIATVTGTMSIFGSGEWILAAASSTNTAAAKAVNTTFTYLNSASWAFTGAGTTELWNIFDDTTKNAWTVRCIYGAAMAGAIISIQRIN